MASVYQDKQQNQQNDSTNLSTSIGKTVSGNNTAPQIQGGTQNQNTAANKYAGMLQDAMNSGAGAFKPQQNDNVVSAQNYLQQVIANKPGSYQSKYTGQLDRLYNQLMGRGPMQYNMNGDALYQNYRQRYMGQGRMNMRDAMGQAAAQTGGYGSSYAQTAGQAAYNSALQQLNEQVPTLQSQAQERFNDETTRMTNQYNLANAADQQAYGRDRDAQTDWMNERNYAADRADTEYNRAWNEHVDQQNTAMNIANMQRQDDADAKTMAQNQVMKWIQSGVKPSREQIRMAGMDYDEVMKYYKKVK